MAEFRNASNDTSSVRSRAPSKSTEIYTQTASQNAEVVRWPVLASYFSLLVSYFSLLISYFSLLISYFSLLVSYFSLLISYFSLPISRFYFRFRCHFLLPLSFPALSAGGVTSYFHFRFRRCLASHLSFLAS